MAWKTQKRNSQSLQYKPPTQRPSKLSSRICPTPQESVSSLDFGKCTEVMQRPNGMVSMVISG